MNGSRECAMAESNSYKNPPKLGTNTVYETWKTEIAVWRLVTDLPKKKQALAVTLSLAGQARAKALEIEVADLNKDDGLDTLITELDGLFRKETVDLAYEAFSNFDKYRKTAEVSMSEFILEYERRYNQCKKYDMTLPDAVLSFRLLDNAGLSQKEKQLALTASSDLKFSSMKSALKRIFKDSRVTNDGDVASDNPSAIKIKQESAFMMQKFDNDVGARRRFQQRRQAQQNNSTGNAPKGTNPIDKLGRRTKCMICQSVFHWAKDCQHRLDPAAVRVTEDACTKEEECNLTLFTKHKQHNEIFMTESFGCAVIDTACTRTVCGQKWLDNYTDNLDVKKKTMIKTSPSKRSFKFGDGVQIQSTKNVIIPAMIGKTPCKIDTEVVDVDIPLLLSKTSLKRAGTVLDLVNDKATMFQHPVTLDFTSSGHYCVDLQDSESNDMQAMGYDEQQDEALLINENASKADQKKILIKLHKQFGHASADRLKRLLESAGTHDTEVFNTLKEVVDNCETCFKFQRPVPKPAVGFPLATDFNETVAVDLHELDTNKWYLHIIDEFTRFSAGAIITSKQSSVFVKHFIDKWISVHGAPKKLYSDNGGEFNNAEVRDMCENFNIELKTTAGYSPWSNGLLERHSILTETMRKVKADNKCSWETALNWSLSAKNSLANVHGYSAYQLVYAQNPNLPSLLVDKPPALEATTASRMVGNNIAAMYAARRAFTEAECSERIRRALRKQTRPTSGPYTMGDKVYYKRPDSPEWKGSGVVIGQDGAVIFIRHGGVMVRVHQCRLKSSIQDEIDHKNDQMADSRPNQSENQPAEMEPDTIVEEEEEEPVNTNEFHNPIHNLANIPKLGQDDTITYRDHDTGTLITARVVGRAGKAMGKYGNWYNLDFLQPDGVNKRQSVDLSQVDDLRVSGTSSNVSDVQEENVMVLEDISMDNAKTAELDSWKQNEVYKEVEDKGQKCISTRWVCTLKQTKDGIRPKARLVARGFEEINNKQIPKDSPTCGKESLRLIIAIIAHNRWRPRSMDIKTAFLQGQKIQRDIFIRPPKEAGCSGKVWHLQKCVYGLGDASLYWYNKVKSVMVQFGAKTSQVDPAVYYWVNDSGDVIGILASHVDDFIWGGTAEFETTVISRIRSEFIQKKKIVIHSSMLGLIWSMKMNRSISIRMTMQIG